MTKNRLLRHTALALAPLALAVVAAQGVSAAPPPVAAIPTLLNYKQVPQFVNILPNPMPVDTNLDWANPGAVGGITPVPVVAHLHGGNPRI